MSWIKNKKESTKNFVLVVFGILAALILAEVGLRFSVPIEPTIADPILGHKMNPKVEGYDEKGFRNASILGKANIVAIGDSQTEGNNAPTEKEAWPQVLGELSGKTVYQMAVGGYGPLHYFYLVDEAVKLNPELVIMGFYTGNDTIETYGLVYGNDYWKEFRDSGFSVSEQVSKEGPSLRTILQSGYAPESFQYKLLKARQWFRSKSYLYTFLGRATRDLREKINLANTIDERNERIADQLKNLPEFAFVYEKKPISAILGPNYRLDSVNLSDDITKEGFRISKVSFVKSNQKLKENNIKLAVAMIPTKEMVYAVYMKESGETLNESMANFLEKESGLRKEFFDFCKDEEIICIDTLPALRALLVEEINAYPFEMDGHPVPAGYAAIADSIHKFLLNNRVYEP